MGIDESTFLAAVRSGRDNHSRGTPRTGAGLIVVAHGAATML